MPFRLVWFWRYELLWPRGFSRRGRRGGHAHAPLPQRGIMTIQRRRLCSPPEANGRGGGRSIICQAVTTTLARDGAPGELHPADEADEAVAQSLPSLWRSPTIGSAEVAVLYKEDIEIFRDRLQLQRASGVRDDVWSAAPGISSDLGTHSLHPWAGRQQTAGSSLHHNHSDQWSQLHHHVLFHSNLWPTAHNTTTTRGPRCLFPATRARPQIMIMPQIPSKKLQLRTAMHPHPSPFID